MSPLGLGALALLALLGGLGCANRITLDPAEDGPAPRVPIGQVLVIEWIETRRAGFEVNPASELIAFCVESFRAPGSFLDVFEPRAAHAAPSGYRLGIRIDDHYDGRPVATGTKLVLTLMTGALPGTVLPYYFDDRVVAEGELETPEGVMRRYRAERSGTIRSFLMANFASAERELRGRIAGEAVSALAREITTDPELAAPPGDTR